VGIEEIKASGLLELYVMDQLSTAERAEVESYIRTYPELQQEIKDIEKALEILALSASKPSPPGLKERILKEIKDEIIPESTTPQSSPNSSLGLWRMVAALFGLGILVGGYLIWQKNKEVQRLEQNLVIQRDSCEQTTQRMSEQLQILQQLTYPDNKIIPFQATPGYASTDLYLHHNAVTKRNFIQVRKLPELASNQSFELWSLKPDQAPIPLDVFELPLNGLIEVKYEEGTATYAITIEPKGGKDSPTLENLIGTVGVGGI
jgi:anti-sigma-K factor RskA